MCLLCGLLDHINTMGNIENTLKQITFFLNFIIKPPAFLNIISNESGCLKSKQKCHIELVEILIFLFANDFYISINSM